MEVSPRLLRGYARFAAWSGIAAVAYVLFETLMGNPEADRYLGGHLYMAAFLVGGYILMKRALRGLR